MLGNDNFSFERFAQIMQQLVPVPNMACMKKGPRIPHTGMDVEISKALERSDFQDAVQMFTGSRNFLGKFVAPGPVLNLFLGEKCIGLAQGIWTFPTLDLQTPNFHIHETA